MRGAASLAFVMFVVSCSSLLQKKDGDAGAEAGAGAEVVDAAIAPGPAALAANEGDVARFPDETKLPDVRATLLQNFNVREAPPAGVVILGLSKGTVVTQIAQREKSILIVFDNPKAPGTKLLGWIHRDAFNAAVVDAGPVQCAKGEIAIFGDTAGCAKACTKDADCPAGQACKGQAKVLTNGKVGDAVTVCNAFQAHDAGAPPAPAPTTPAIVDGGRAAVTDAGNSFVKPIVVDAGKAPTPTGPAADVVAATAGKCPASFVLVAKTGKCHRSCANGADNGERIRNNCRNANPFCIKCDKDQKFVCAEAQDQCR